MTEHEHVKPAEFGKAQTQHVRTDDMGKPQWALRKIALAARNMATFADSSRGLDPILVEANLRGCQEHLQNAVREYVRLSGGD